MVHLALPMDISSYFIVEIEAIGQPSTELPAETKSDLFLL